MEVDKLKQLFDNWVVQINVLLIIIYCASLIILSFKWKKHIFKLIVDNLILSLGIIFLALSTFIYYWLSIMSPKYVSGVFDDLIYGPLAFLFFIIGIIMLYIGTFKLIMR